MSKTPQTASGGKTAAATIYICVKEKEAGLKTIPVAMTVADALEANVTLVHVIDPAPSAQAPCDPVEWDLVKRKAGTFLADLAAQFPAGHVKIKTRILEGHSADQLCGCASAKHGDITAICRGGTEDYGKFGSTARLVMETAQGSFLMIPADMPQRANARFKRVLVPLDGSAQAEAAIPMAVNLARHQDAELVFVHATPEPVLTKISPLEAKDYELIDRFKRRNERVARDYLIRMEHRVNGGVQKKARLVLTGGDVRRALVDDTALTLDDIIVLSSHGHSGFSDVPLGDVASFLIARSVAPVLMVRRSQTEEATHNHANTKSKGVRLPAGEAQ